MPEPATTDTRARDTRGRMDSARARSSSRLALIVLAIAIACGLVVAACGSSSTTSSTSSTTSATSGTSGTSGTTPSAGSATATAGGSFVAYRSCLKAHGVTLPTGGGFPRPAGGAPTSTTPTATGTTGRPALGTTANQKALTACAGLRPAGAGRGLGGRGVNSTNPAFAKFQACLKSHGVQTGAAPSSSATAACRSLLPAGGFRPGGAGGTGGANSAVFAKYQACLKQHGVQTSAAGQSSAKLTAAIAACRGVLSSRAGSSSATTTTG
jgi:hypothetical protein